MRDMQWDCHQCNRGPSESFMLYVGQDLQPHTAWASVAEKTNGGEKWMKWEEHHRDCTRGTEEQQQAICLLDKDQVHFRIYGVLQAKDHVRWWGGRTAAISAGYRSLVDGCLYERWRVQSSVATFPTLRGIMHLQQCANQPQERGHWCILCCMYIYICICTSLHLKTFFDWAFPVKGGFDS